MKDLLGICFQNNPVLSQLNTCSGLYPSMIVHSWNSLPNLSASSFFALAPSPCPITLWIPDLLLNFSNHPLLHLNSTSASAVLCPATIFLQIFINHSGFASDHLLSHSVTSHLTLIYPDHQKLLHFLIHRNSLRLKSQGLHTSCNWSYLNLLFLFQNCSY